MKYLLVCEFQIPHNSEFHMLSNGGPWYNTDI